MKRVAVGAHLPTPRHFSLLNTQIIGNRLMPELQFPSLPPRLHDAIFVEQRWWIFVETCWPTKVEPCGRPGNIVEHCSLMLQTVQACSNIHGCSRTSILFIKSRIVQTGLKCEHETFFSQLSGLGRAPQPRLGANSCEVSDEHSQRAAHQAISINILA